MNRTHLNTMEPNDPNEGRVWVRPCFRSDRRFASGITLVELLIVLVILAAVAGFASFTLFSDGVTVAGSDGEERSQAEITTVTSLQAVRDALIGTATDDSGYHGDLGKLPRRLGGLIQNIDGEDDYNFATKRGWQGYSWHRSAIRSGC